GSPNARLTSAAVMPGPIDDSAAANSTRDRNDLASDWRGIPHPDAGRVPSPIVAKASDSKAILQRAMDAQPFLSGLLSPRRRASRAAISASRAHSGGPA